MIGTIVRTRRGGRRLPDGDAHSGSTHRGTAVGRGGIPEDDSER
ncbi:MAG: hypothetical protein JWP46_3443 [Modestobacter sp.]|nr:hypothetical protein [Modestobacter sp.]